MLDYPLQDVITLMRQHLDHNRRAKPQGAVSGPKYQSNTQEVIYRKADDSWF